MLPRKNAIHICQILQSEQNHLFRHHSQTKAFTSLGSQCFFFVDERSIAPLCRMAQIVLNIFSLQKQEKVTISISLEKFC